MPTWNNLICEICKKTFKARRPKGIPKPKYCSQSCYSIHMKKRWNDPEYRSAMIQKHKLNTTKYWLGKKRPDMLGSKNPNWKQVKGHYINTAGYRVLYRPKHQLADKKGCVLEHHHIWFKNTGQKILPNEVIHHKNEIKTDNRFENLKLMTKKQHMQHHRQNGSKIT